MAIAHGISLASAAKVKYNNIYGNQPGKPLQVPIGGNVGLLNQSGTAIVATVTAPPHSGRNRSTRTAAGFPHMRRRIHAVRSDEESLAPVPGLMCSSNPVSMATSTPRCANRRRSVPLPNG